MSNKVADSPLYDIFQQLKMETFKDLRVCLPGSIVGIDLPTGTVSVAPGVMQNIAKQGLPKGLDFKYPTLTMCPVFTLQGGGVGAVMPIKIGDGCLIIFSDRCISTWYSSGQANPLPSLRMHDISDGFVLVGLNPAPEVNKLKTPLSANEGGICETKSFTGAKIVVNSVTHKVDISNSTKNLATILGTLVTTINALNTTLAAMTTASIASGATQTVIATYTSTFTTLIADLIALLY